MSGTSTNRERAARFRDNRRYFHRTSPVGAWKVRLAVVALIGTLAWTAYSLAVPASLREDVSRGPLARVHGRWDAECQACHTPYAETQGIGGLVDCRDRWQAFRCDTCHAGAPGDERNYAPHHATAIWPASRGNDCAACHRDHQGADFSLVRVADADCVQCHRDLKNYHTKPTDLKYENAITGFADHPEFRLKANGPARTMKFSHGLHLNPGIVASSRLLGNPNAVKTLDKIPEKYRKQYEAYSEGQTGLQMIQLDCAACHQLESSNVPRAAGDYYLPVKFDQHCAACHEQMLSDLKTPAGIGVAGFTVPHGRPAADLERAVRAEVARQITGRDTLLQKVPVIPPDRLDPPRPKEIAVPSNLKAETDRLVATYLESLTGRGLADGQGCLKCHEPAAAGGLTPTRVSNVWLKSARFNHAAHRAMKCAACHDKGPTDFTPETFVEKEPLAIPGIDNCRQCHGPAGTKAGKPVGGVRYGCVDCHSYHHRTPPTWDRGLNVEELLRAKRD